MFKKLLLGLVAFCLAGAAALFLVFFPPIKATHPSLTQGDLPPIVPLRDFYADPNARWAFDLSPDGSRIAWLEAKRLKPALWVSELGSDDAEVYHTGDVVRWFTWSPDGRYLIYLADRDGWENDQLVSVDVTKPGSAPRTYDFGRDVRTWIEFIPRDDTSEILISHNGRDRSRFDLYRLNLDSGDMTALDLISERGVGWSFDRLGRVFARKVNGEKSNWHVDLRNEDGTWRKIAEGGMEDAFWALTPPDETGEMIAISNLGRDKHEAVYFNAATGAERTLFAHPDVDVGWLRLHPDTDEPVLISASPGYREVTIFDEKVREMVALFGDLGTASLHLSSTTRDFSKAIWDVQSDTAGWTTYLVDQLTSEIAVLNEAGIAEHAGDLSPTEPVFITASDGLTIPAFLTRPNGVSGPAPMVISIHGGPVARSFWGWNDIRQYLANRGYAVLTVNYRGGSGYGRAFREAAIGEVSRKMHQDIVDARQWAVDQGYADPDKVAAFGGSFGGLKTLTALTETPDLFAAGIAINAISDLSTMLDEVPVYWSGWPDWVRKYLGDPENPDDLATIKDRSPLYHADKLTSPLMMIQGANDVRVIRSQADRMVAALKERGKPVQYELIKGAGHTFSNMTWQQKMLMHRKIERFLAEHLGGRADGFDYGVLGAMIIP